MRCVYQAENSIDAHLVRGVLEQHGIPAYVFGDFLAGAIGELPVWGLIEVHVANQHFADAEALVREIARDAESAPIDDELVPKPA